MKLTPVPLVLLLALAACTTPDRPDVKPEARPTFVLPSPTFPPAAPPEIDCGVHAIKQGEGLPETAMACIIDAAARGRPAFLEETRPNVEGGPITTQLRVRRDGTVAVTRDTTKAVFETKGVFYETCTGPQASFGMIMFARCVPATAEGTPRR